MSSIQLNQISPQRINELTMIDIAYRRAAADYATPWKRRSTVKRPAPAAEPARPRPSTEITMKHARASEHKGLRRPPTSRRLALVPRTTYPNVSLVPLQTGLLARLAWIFGFRS